MAQNLPTIPTTQQGNENRASILPSLLPGDMGVFTSSYSPADSLLGPAAIGVHADDTLDSVIQAVKGVGYYTDMIGFGASSNSLTSDMPLKPLGLNDFVNTGQYCSNGAPCYQYFKGIPDGSALGEKVKKNIAAMGLPPLQGLAPGMMEDAKEALNPMNLLNAMLGSGYPQCKRVTLMVGDMYGNISDPENGTPWIRDTKTAVKGPDGLYYQSQWILDAMVDKELWEKTPKIYNKDGTLKATTKATTTVSGFTGSTKTIASTIVVVGLLGLIAYTVSKRK